MDERRQGESDKDHSTAQLPGLGYGARFFRIGGISVYLHNCPECLEHDEYQCALCEHFSPSNCPLRRSPYYISNVRTMLALRRRHWLVADRQRELREELLHAASTELRAHGRPLHYAVLARIIADRHPTLLVSSRRVLLVLSSNPDRFYKLRQGVYGLKEASER